MKNRINIKQLLMFFIVVVIVSCSNNEEDSIEIFNAKYSCEEGFRFTRVENLSTPIDSVYLSIKEPLQGNIIINKTQNITQYIINGFNLKMNTSTTINNLVIKIQDNKIIGISSNDIKSGFCASSVILENHNNGICKTIKFIETEDSSIGFHVVTSLDTTTIRLTGTINIESFVDKQKIKH